MNEIKATDIAGNPLQIGNFVEYANTGTRGNVTEIISDDEGTWALIDKTNLYYKTEILRIIKKVDRERTRRENILPRGNKRSSGKTQRSLQKLK